MLITKTTGEQEEFDESKLRFSLFRAGADQPIIEDIVTEITKKIIPGATTNWLYKEAFKMLKQRRSSFAAKYSMKRALMKLGPTGFPFEDFLGEIFKTKGYTVQTGVMMAGRCVEHEIDMYAKSPNKTIIAEAKYHNQSGIATDLKVVLYVWARMEDLQQTVGKSDPNLEGWLITNTAFTENAIKYANCVGLKAVSWSYPEKGNLMDLIEEARLHPITCLITPTSQEKKKLVENGIVLCKSLADQTAKMKSLGFDDKKINQIIAESNNVCLP